MKRPRTLIAAIAAGTTLVLVGCSAGSTDFKEAAEKAITSDKGGLGKGSSAKCEKPASTDVGTTFECTGTGPDGTVYAITATIDKKNHVVVNSTGVITPSDSTADTTSDSTADSTADSTGDGSASTDTTGG